VRANPQARTNVTPVMLTFKILIMGGTEWKAFVIEAREKRGLQPGLLQLKINFPKIPYVT